MIRAHAADNVRSLFHDDDGAPEPGIVRSVPPAQWNSSPGWTSNSRIFSELIKRFVRVRHVDLIRGHHGHRGSAWNYGKQAAYSPAFPPRYEKMISFNVVPTGTS